MIVTSISPLWHVSRSIRRDRSTNRRMSFRYLRWTRIFSVCKPGLKRKHVPERGAPFFLAAGGLAMGVPSRANHLWVQYPLIADHLLVKKIVGPFLERSAKPACERRHETAFRALEKLRRHITRQNFAQQRFAFAMPRVHRRGD